jgi:predicted TIM-barrel fold metal-dependent hydrolase
MAFTLPALRHDFRVLDIHHHVGSIAGYFGAAAEVTDPKTAMAKDVDARLRFMDEWGIEQALLMPASGQPAVQGMSDIRRYNDYVVEYRIKHPDRFVLAAGCVNPQDGDAALRELERCTGELGMQAMAWHHRFQGCNINHPGMRALLRALAQRGLPALIHIIAESTLESPWRLEVLADEHPDVSFIALDAFSTPNQASWMQYIAKKHANIYFETGVLSSVAHGLDHFVQVAGHDRLLFGTDYYSSPKVMHTPFPLYELLASSLPDEAKRAVLGGNSRRLFRLP